LEVGVRKKAKIPEVTDIDILRGKAFCRHLTRRAQEPANRNNDVSV
jgi:hypothetical protein